MAAGGCDRRPIQGNGPGGGLADPEDQAVRQPGGLRGAEGGQLHEPGPQGRQPARPVNLRGQSVGGTKFQTPAVRQVTGAAAVKARYGKNGLRARLQRMGAAQADRGQLQRRQIGPQGSRLQRRLRPERPAAHIAADGG